MLESGRPATREPSSNLSPVGARLLRGSYFNSFFFCKAHYEITYKSDRAMAVDLDIEGRKIRIIAAYVPHGGYGWTDFEDTMEEISELVLDAQRYGRKVIIGGDFNLSLHTGHRGNFMTTFCAEHSLVISNGTGPADTSENWTFRSRLGALRRIDYIVYGAGLSCLNSRAIDDLDLGSDHRCVQAGME